MGESFDHRPPGWIRQSRKCCTQSIHNHMVVDCLSMSRVNFAIPDFCSVIPVGSLDNRDECEIAESLIDPDW